jgi:hypothetical protein
MEILQYGIAPALVLVIWGLVDKVLGPLLSKKLANGNGNGGSWSHQNYINDETGKRIEDLERQADEVRESLSEIRAKVDVSTAILRRVEESLK